VIGVTIATGGGFARRGFAACRRMSPGVASLDRLTHPLTNLRVGTIVGMVGDQDDGLARSRRHGGSSVFALL
jgi:hypothetical protein